MKLNNKPSGHAWRFFQIGGLLQVQLDRGADLVALKELDQKLWAAPMSVLVFPYEYYMSERWGDRAEDVEIRTLAQRAEQLVGANETVISPVLGQYAFLHKTAVLNSDIIFDNCEQMQTGFNMLNVKFALYAGADSTINMVNACYESIPIDSCKHYKLYRIERKSL
jgi:hypothetical protein